MERNCPGLRREQRSSSTSLEHNRVTLRCDNETAIEALAREIAQAHQEGSQTNPERPPAEERQSNGIIERTVGLVPVPPDARILCWLVEFAAYLMNRCDIGSDGKTPLHRLHDEGTAHRSSSLERRTCTCPPSQ